MIGGAIDRMSRANQRYGVFGALLVAALTGALIYIALDGVRSAGAQ